MIELTHRRRYRLHGVGLEVATNDLAAAGLIDSKLRCFPDDGAGSLDLRYEIRLAPDARPHSAPAPGRPTRLICELPPGELVYSPSEDRLFLLCGDRVRVCCDPEPGLVRVSIHPGPGDDAWLAAHLLFSAPLLEMLKRRGLFGIHAAGVRTAGQGILISGLSGAGKSTLAVALLRGGLGFMGDDTLFLRPTSDGVDALAFPDELDVTDSTARFFPELAPLLAPPRAHGRPKRSFRAEELFEVEPVESCRPTVLVFPRIADALRSSLQAMSRDEALQAIAPNVYLTQARASQAHLDALASLVRQCRCFRLATGRDFDALPDLFRSLAT